MSASHWHFSLKICMYYVSFKFKIVTKALLELVSWSPTINGICPLHYSKTSKANGRNSSKWTGPFVGLSKTLKIIKISKQNFKEIIVLSNG